MLDSFLSYSRPARERKATNEGIGSSPESIPIRAFGHKAQESGSLKSETNLTIAITMSCEDCVQQGCTFCRKSDRFDYDDYCRCGSFDGFFQSCDDYSFGSTPVTSVGGCNGHISIIVIVVVSLLIVAVAIGIFCFCRRRKASNVSGGTPSSGLPTTTSTFVVAAAAAPPTTTTPIPALHVVDSSNPTQQITGKNRLDELEETKHLLTEQEYKKTRERIRLDELEKAKDLLTEQEYEETKAKILGVTAAPITVLPPPTAVVEEDIVIEPEEEETHSLADYLETIDRFDRRSAIAKWFKNSKNSLQSDLSPEEFANALSKIPFSYDVPPAAREIAEGMGGKVTCFHVLSSMRQHKNENFEIATSLAPFIQDVENKDSILNELSYSYQKDEICKLLPP